MKEIAMSRCALGMRGPPGLDCGFEVEVKDARQSDEADGGSFKKDAQHLEEAPPRAGVQWGR